MRSPLWWAGSFGDLFGFILQGVALAFGAVALVQPLLVIGPAARHPDVGRRRQAQGRARRDRRRAAVLRRAWSTFVVAAQPTDRKRGDHRSRRAAAAEHRRPRWSRCSSLGTMRTTGVVRSVALALCAGTLFGVCSPLLSVIVRDLHHLFGLAARHGRGLRGHRLPADAERLPGRIAAGAAGDASPSPSRSSR